MAKERSGKRDSELRKRAEKILTLDPQAIRTMVPANIQKLIHELNVHQIELEIQNAELHRVQLELQEARDKYLNLYDFAPMGYFTLGRNSLIIDVNLAGSELLGSEKHRLIGAQFTASISPDSQDAFYFHCREVLKTGIEGNCELEMLKADGTLFLAQLISIAMPKKDGNISHYRTAVIDITERRQAERTLRESEANYRELANSISDVFFGMDKDLRYTYWNKASEKLTGTIAKDALGKHLYDIFPADEATQRAERVYREVLKTKQSRRFINHCPINDRDFWFSIGVYPTETGISVFVSDITENMQMEEALRKSESKYSTLVEKGNDGIVVIQDGLFRFANFRMVEMAGFSLDETLGRPFIDFIAPDYKALVMNLYRARMSGKEVPNKYEAAIVTKDGREISVEINASLIEYESKPADLAFIRDITERKRVEQLFRDLFETSMIGIYIAQDGKFHLANRQFQKLVGYTEEELLNKDPLLIVFPDDREMVRKSAISMLKRNCFDAYEYRYITKSGEVRWVAEVVASIDYFGKRATLGSFMDTTGTKKIEEQILTTSKLASIGELAAGVAHEINNPLTGIIGYAQLLTARQDVSTDIKEDLSKIYEESQRAVKIVQNLLRFAHHYQPDRSYVDINELIQRTLELRSYELRTSNIELVTKLTPNLPWVLADYNQLQQVFMNIIVNAEQAIAEVKHQGKITVATDTVGDCVRIISADSGPGISEENISKIFDPFFTTKPVGSGSGLGLSVCHGIISQHGGRIYAESKSGEGATFFIELPVATVAEADIEKGEVTVKEKKRHQPKNGKNILVIEDESAIREVLKRALAAEGYQVDITTDGKTGIAMMQKKPYDLYIVDLKMPGMGGSELYRIVNKKHPAEAEKIVFITGDTITPETHDFLVATGRPYLSKPFEHAELLKLVE